jgi:CheY-like chemotaxis protein
MTDDAPGILVVDDEDGLARLYQIWLQEGDHSADVTTDPTTIDYGTVEEVAVLVVDRSMPDTTGDELLRELTDAGFDGRTIVVSAIDVDTDIIDLPLDAYLQKPVSKPALNDAVSRVLAWEDYTPVLGAYARAVSKAAVIRAELSADRRQQSEAYRGLVGRIHRLHDDVRDTLEDLDEVAFVTVFGDGDRAAIARRPAETLAVEPPQETTDIE